MPRVPRKNFRSDRTVQMTTRSFFAASDADDNSNGIEPDKLLIESPTNEIEPDHLSNLHIDNHHSPTPKNASTVAGAFCMFICVSTWVLMSETIPLLSSNYNKPYFLRYCVGSCYSIMLIVYLLLNKCRLNRNKIVSNTMLSSFFLSILYNISGYSWYLSLDATIAAVNNTIYQSSVAMAYIFSVLFIKTYKMALIKNISVLFCLGGVALIAFGSSGTSDNSESNTWYGIIECLIATLGFALVEVSSSIYGNKYFINTQNDNQYANNKWNRIKDMFFMQGMMGLACLLTLWPPLIVLNYYGIEVFELPNKSDDILCIVLTSVMDTVYAAAFLVAISFTNPVFVAVTQLLVVPITFFIDVIFQGFNVTLMAISGTFLLLIGFILMEIPFLKYTKQYRKKTPFAHETKEQLLVNVPQK